MNLGSPPIISGLLAQFSQRMIGLDRVLDTVLLHAVANMGSDCIMSITGFMPGLPCAKSFNIDIPVPTANRAVCIDVN